MHFWLSFGLQPMLNIKLTTSFPEWPVLRQTPQSLGIWDHCHFSLNQDIRECDFWVVYEGLMRPEKVLCPPENSIFITGEPPNVKKYNPRFLSQFSIIITFRRDIEHQNVIHMQTALPWHVGRRVRWNINISFDRNYDELASIRSFNKTKLISVISSNKLLTEDHKSRLLFIRKLSERFGKEINIFGRGINDIEDKWDAIAPYQYHIVIENGAYQDYFTEKIADTFLAGAYPFYYGATNLSDYFPKNSFTMINIHQPEEAFEIMRRKIQDKIYMKSIQGIMGARSLVLNKYNLFPMLSELLNTLPMLRKKTELLLLPEHYFH